MNVAFCLFFPLGIFIGRFCFVGNKVEGFCVENQIDIWAHKFIWGHRGMISPFHVFSRISCQCDRWLWWYDRAAWMVMLINRLCHSLVLKKARLVLLLLFILLLEMPLELSLGYFGQVLRKDMHWDNFFWEFTIANESSHPG